MCIAIHRKVGGVLSKKTLWNCWESNPDGAGFMYAEGGRLIVNKGFFKFKQLWKAIRPHLMTHNRELVIHFRIATSGKVDYANCHPHFINDGLAYVHNGIISELNDDKKVCDTVRFAELLGQLPKNFINNPGIMKLIEMSVGYSKFVFMDSSGAVQYINREFGIETEGTWYSNSGFRWSRSERAFSYPGKGLVYDYGWERASYGGLKPAIATPINKLATSEAEEKAEEAMHEYYEGDSCYDDDLELPPSAYFDHYQRYDGDFNTDLGNLDEGIEDEFGMTASDYNGNAEEEFYFWLDHPEFIESAAYRDLTEMESGLGLTNFRFFMQAWLDLYEPDYTKLYHRVKPTAHVVSTKTTTETTDKRAAIQEVINIATKNLTEPVKFSLGEKKAGAE